MICSSCATDNQADFKFCRECGQRLAAPASPRVTNGAPPADARLDEVAQAARLLDQAFDLYDDGQLDDARGCCMACLALDPTGTTAHSLLGMIYERQGKTAQAVQEYQLVLQMNPNSVADATKLDALLNVGDTRKGAARSRPAAVAIGSRRVPGVAGAAAAAVVLVVGLWVTMRAVDQSNASARRVSARETRAPEPGASMPRPPAPSMGMPGAEESLARARQPMPGAALEQPFMAPMPGASQGASGFRQPSAATAWPGQRGAFSPAMQARGFRAAPSGPAWGAGTPAAGPAGLRTGRGYSNPGYLAPAPIGGVEKLSPGAPQGMARVPGAALPPFPGATPAVTTPQRAGRGPMPVLPPVAPGAETSEAPPAAPSASAPAPPPSASISIQPLDDPEPAGATQGARLPTAPAPRGVSLGDALRHQQMAAYYRRQGDPQAAYDEYQSARDLFRGIQQRGGRDAAVAAQGALAAQNGMSRLQGP